jgi:hypothetical protein
MAAELAADASLAAVPVVAGAAAPGADASSVAVPAAAAKGKTAFPYDCSPSVLSGPSVSRSALRVRPS